MYNFARKKWVVFLKNLHSLQKFTRLVVTNPDTDKHTENWIKLVTCHCKDISAKLIPIASQSEKKTNVFNRYQFVLIFKQKPAAAIFELSESVCWELFNNDDVSLDSSRFDLSSEASLCQYNFTFTILRHINWISRSFFTIFDFYFDTFIAFYWTQVRS